ncbi:MAG: hypothetical protein JSU79_02150, partial [Dehalococcoidales bacterium]
MADEETKTQENTEEAPVEAEQAAVEEAPAAEEAPPAEEKPKAEKAPAKKATKKAASSGSIIDQIKNMTVLELAELVKALEEEFGVTAAVPVTGPIGPGPQPSEPEEEKEEKSEFNVVLKEIG